MAGYNKVKAVAMPEKNWLKQQAHRSLERIWPRLEASFGDYSRRCPEEWAAYRRRVETHFATLFARLYELYGGQYDFFYHLENLLVRLAHSWEARPPALKQQDEQREASPGWFLDNHMLGGVSYVDLFAGDLDGIRRKIPYFKELGLTYLHLMPLFAAPEGENDGGYAVSSYREVNPALGSMTQLAGLAEELRQEGICLVLDFIFNHTSDQHEWAQRARAGEAVYQDFYRIFPDRSLPDQYELSLREIFPDEHPGAFTFDAALGKWVWTTFHRYQWDLNYDNPEVFIHMAEELLFLANQGVDVIRLDAVAFIWKRMGTNCENLPEAHQLIQAFNAAARIAAPGLLFKSEAIVHPDDVVKYISPLECQVSYNPLLMALLWEALSTRDARMLALALRERFQIPEGCAWVNYVRCHDDIGWTFSDEDAARLNINGFDHRRFLNAFYTGRFPGSFARGLPFQENPKTGDCRISGTCASLAGLEKALREEGEAEVELAVRRILLIHGVILTAGGIPLLYLGDEVGMLNDYAYLNDPDKAADSRWLHRPYADPRQYERRALADTVEGRIYQGLQNLIRLRRETPEFAGQDLHPIDTGSSQVLGYARGSLGPRVLVLANFSEQQQVIPASLLRLYGLSYQFTDLISGQPLPFADLELAPYQFIALRGLAEGQVKPA
jgi:amylosucrase